MEASPVSIAFEVINRVNLKEPIEKAMQLSASLLNLRHVELDGHAVRLDLGAETLWPLTPEGDAFFGLELGTNGTAATCRRLLLAPEHYKWTRHDGRPATGLTLIPSGHDNSVNPWDGPVIPARAA